jgi:hypothetical protein
VLGAGLDPANSAAAAAAAPSSAATDALVGDDDDDQSMEFRRLLQFTPSPSQVGVSLLSSAGTPILQRLLPSIKNSPLASWLFDNIQIEEHFAYWPSLGRQQVVPVLSVNGSFSLDRYPFNALGLRGAIDVHVQVSPWYGSQFGPLRLPSSPLQILMHANYPINLDFGAGIKLNNVYLAVDYAPRRRRGQPSTVMYTVGGSMDFSLSNQDTALTLDASVTMQSGLDAITLEATVTNWQNAFGLEWLTMNRVTLFAILGVPELYVDITAQWTIAGKTLKMQGIKTGSFIGAGVQVFDISANEIASMFTELFGGSLAPTEVEVLFNTAFVGVANSPGYVLGYEMQRGITIHANVDIWSV